MPLKLNISNKGKAWKLELDASILDGKSIGDKIPGKTIKPELEGYELEITGGSDFAGFPMMKNVEGIGLKRVLLTKGWGMHKKPKGDKKKVSTPKGLRLRKTVRGKSISDKSVQINLKVEKEGSKKLEDIFPDQNKKAEPEKTSDAPSTEAPKDIKTEAPTDNSKMKDKEEIKEEVKEEIKEEVKEEIKEDIPSSPETKTEDEKEEAAEKVAEEVAEDVSEDIAEKEKK